MCDTGEAAAEMPASLKRPRNPGKQRKSRAQQVLSMPVSAARAQESTTAMHYMTLSARRLTDHADQEGPAAVALPVKVDTLPHAEQHGCARGDRMAVAVEAGLRRGGDGMGASICTKRSPAIWLCDTRPKQSRLGPLPAMDRLFSR